MRRSGPAYRSPVRDHDYGPVDPGAADVPRAIRVGLIGPSDQLDGLRRWLESCREPIAAKVEKYRHLFPGFSRCDTGLGLHTALVFSDRNARVISSRDLRAVETADDQPAALIKAVSVYAEEIRAPADENRVDVPLFAGPGQLIGSVSRPAGSLKRAGGPPLRGALDDTPAVRFANFHDLLKARLLHLCQPIPVIRRSTWDEATRPPEGRSRRDAASRAWKLHVALYCKAGGVPWRLLGNPSDLTTCSVGVAFYRNGDGSAVGNSVAQVFNERGDGAIVRGGPARISGGLTAHGGVKSVSYAVREDAGAPVFPVSDKPPGRVALARFVHVIPWRVRVGVGSSAAGDVGRSGVGRAARARSRWALMTAGVWWRRIWLESSAKVTPLVQ